MPQTIRTRKHPKSDYEPEVNGTIPNDQIWDGNWFVLLNIVVPIAITGLIIGRKAIFNKLSANFDKICISVFCPSFSKREKLRKWLIEYLPFIDGVDGVKSIWQDGSLMCTLINSVIPGACLNPHRHWKRPPIHGQALAYKYLGVAPVFSEKDFELVQPTTTMENLLLEYMSSLQQAMDKLTALKLDALSFSTRYIARGMGLITGEQHRRIVFYVYFNHTDHTDDLLINIRGPYNTFGSTTLTSSCFTRNNASNIPEKRASFLKTLSADFSNLLKAKEREHASDIEIRKEFESKRVKITFIPKNSGVYEICLTTNGEHIAGSPFNLNIDKNRSGITDDLNDNDSKMGKKKVLNTVNYYERLKKPRSNANDLKDQTVKKDTISLSQAEPLKEEEVEADPEVTKSTDTENSATNTVPLDDATKSTNSESTNHEKHADEAGKTTKKDNFGLNIIDTIRDIPELVKIYTEVSKRPDFEEILNPVMSESDLNIDHSEIQVDTSGNEEISEDSLQDVAKTVDDSGAFTNEEIDPDSLTLNVEIHEENFLSEVNNNDVMVKSNEDICYLVLNRRNTHSQVYSKDFIRCKDEKSKDDLSRSDPNLHNPDHYEHDVVQQHAVSALSQDNVHEAHHHHHDRHHQTSRILIEHPQEGRIGCTRGHSYSYNSLIEPKPNRMRNDAFRESFLRRKEFWMNLSTSSMNLHRTDLAMSANSLNKHYAFKTKAKSLQRLNSVDEDERRTKSLDCVQRRNKVGWRTDMHFAYSDANYGSVDDLNFPSVKDRRELFLREQDGQCAKEGKVRTLKGDQFPGSIHQTIKYFETQRNATSRMLGHRQGNIKLRNKSISKGYERAASFFKSLENNSTAADEYSDG